MRGGDHRRAEQASAESGASATVGKCQVRFHKIGKKRENNEENEVSVSQKPQRKRATYPDKEGLIGEKQMQ